MYAHSSQQLTKNDPEEWLTNRAQGYVALKHSERQAIAYFCLLWSLFEAQKMTTQASARRICETVKSWSLQGALDIKLYEEPLAYFKKRYLSADGLTPNFYGLNFRPQDKRAAVEAVLRGTSRDVCDIVAELLLITFRLRNNLFHGVKWGDELRDQENNFSYANQVLIRTLEIDT